MSNPIRAIANISDITAECIAEILKGHGITANINVVIKVEDGKVEAFQQMSETYFTLETRIDNPMNVQVQVIETKNMQFITCISCDDIEKCIMDIKLEEVAEPTELHKEEKQSKTLIQIFDADDFPNVLGI